LEEGRARYDSDSAIWTVGETYQQVGEHLQTAQLTDDARRAYESALAIFTEMQSKQLPENRREFDASINSVRERLVGLSSALSESMVNDDDVPTEPRR
jgi:hypothetical protein